MKNIVAAWQERSCLRIYWEQDLPLDRGMTVSVMRLGSATTADLNAAAIAAAAR
jgi:hypothetical protein